MMTEGRLAYAEELTRVARQVVGVVLVSWQRTLRVGLITAAVTLLAAEIVACLVTASFPPPSLAHLVACALAFAIGYSASLTMLFALLLRGGLRFIHHLEGDVTVGAEAASVFARREVGDLSASIRRFFQNRRRAIASRPIRAPGSTGPVQPAYARLAAKSRPSVARRGGANPAAVAAVGLDVARVAMPRSLPADVRRDPDDAVMRTPPPAMQSLPVLASRLPRIGWTYDEQPATPVSVPAAITASPVPPTPWASSTLPAPTTPLSQPQSEASAFTEATKAAAAAEAIETAEAPQAAGLAGAIPDAPGLIPRGWRRPDPTTRPLPAVTRPLGGVRSGGLWGRVSQALIGQAAAEPAPETEAPEAAPPTQTPQAARAEQPLVHSDIAPEDAWLNG